MAKANRTKDTKKDEAPKAGASAKRAPVTRRTAVKKAAAKKSATRPAAAPRELSRSGLEALRDKLRRKFHKR